MAMCRQDRFPRHPGAAVSETHAINRFSMLLGGIGLPELLANSVSALPSMFFNPIPDSVNSTERRSAGCVIVLPGIEGKSYWNRSIVRGLLHAEVPYGIEIFDWTTGYRGLGVYHLRSRALHQRASARLTEKIIDYRHEHPQQPLYLVGHSGGGAMSMVSLAQLPNDVRVTGAIMLGPALSPWYNVVPALHRTTHGAWNFSSIGDAFFLGVGTTLAGTLDGWHVPSAGMIGFSKHIHAKVQAAGTPPLREMPYQLQYARHRNLSGHFGYTTPEFTASVIAPIMRTSQDTAARVF